MASFDYFSQMQGPVVNTSLFSDAATQGIAAGKNLPTKTTALVQGIQQGLDRGVQDIKNINEVTQIPVENQIRQEQLQSQQQLNEINQLKLEAARQTQAQNLEIAKQQAQNDLTDIQNERAIATALSDPNPQTRARVLQDPNFTGTLLRKKELSAAVLSRIANDPQQPAEVRQQALVLQSLGEKQDHDEKMAAIAARNRELITGDPAKIMENYRKSNLPSAFSELGIDITNPKDYQKVLEFEAYQDSLKNFTDNKLDASKPDNDLSVVKQMNPGKYAGVYNGTKANVLLNDQDQNALSELKSYFAALGVRREAPAPTNAPQAAPVAAKESQPFLGNFLSAAKEGVAGVGQAMSNATRNFIPERPQPVDTTQAGPSPQVTPPAGPQIQTQSDDVTTQIKRAALERQAQADPDFRNRLIAKGKIAGEITPPSTGAVPAEAVPTPTPSGGEGIGGAGGGGVSATPLTPEEVHKALTPSAKKYVEVGKLQNVQAETLVSNLSPLQKAVVAVESGGKRNAKNKESSATGLFQLTTAAAKDTGVNKSNPVANVQGGVDYLNKQLADYNNHEIPALLAYRLGPAIIKEASQIVNSITYDSLVAGINYLKSQGRFKAALTDTNLKEALTYPFKVLAYKEAFEVLGRGRSRS